MAYSYNGQQPPYPNTGYNPQGQNPYQQMNQPQQPGWNQNAFYTQPPPRMNTTAYATETGQGDKRFDFTEASIRAAFIRKVFMMVSIMLLVVAIMTAVPFMDHSVKSYVRSSPALYFCSYGVFLAVYIALMCCESVRRSFPANLICTAILTLSIGYMTMMLCSMYDIVPVLLTLIITTVCCSGIIVFSMQTKHDLTSKMGYLFIASLALMVFGFVAIIASAIFHVKFIYTIYAGLASLLFMFYLAVDIQMLMGGKKYELSPEDHIFAAIQIFLDIVYIFWMLLSIIGGSSSEETSKYNYRYLYAYPEEGKEKTGSFHISLTSNGNKNEWRTVINDDGNIGILKKIPTLKSVFQKDDYKNKFNIINNKNVRKKYSTNYRKAPIVYEWTSPPNFQENLFNNFLLSDNNHKTNTPFSSLQTLENKKEENSSDKTLMNPSSNQKVEQFLHSPEFFNSNFNQKIDFSIPWFGARFYEKHQPILNSIYPSDFVKQHAINAYGNGKHLFDEMQDKLNNLFKDLNF